MKTCLCGRKKITRGKYCPICKKEARRFQANSYYARRGRRLRILKNKREKKAKP